MKLASGTPRMMRFLSLKIALAYFILGVLWILLSDMLANQLFSRSVQTMVWFSMVKGIVFVTLTTVLLFALIDKSITVVRGHAEKLQSERNLLRSIIDNLPDYVYVRDKNFRLTLLNRSVEKTMFGDEVRNRQAHAFFQSTISISPQVREQERHVMETGVSVLNQEETLPFQPGGIFLTSRVPLRNGDNDIHGVVCISRDITELKHQAQLADQYRENLDTLFANTNEDIALLDREGKVLLFNKSLGKTIATLRGRKPEVGEFVWDLVPADRRDTARSVVYQVTTSGQSVQFETVFNVDGERLFLDVKYNPVFIAGELKYITIVSWNVTAMKRQAEQLLRSQVDLSAIFDNTSEVFVLLNEDFTIRLCNKAFAEVWKSENPSSLGKNYQEVTEDMLVGRHILDFVREGRMDRASWLIEEVSAGKTVTYVRSIEVRGVTRWFDVTARPIAIGHNTRGYCLSMVDQTDIRATKEILRSSEMRFRAMVENSNEIFAIMDNQMQNLYMSPNVSKILGYRPEELLGGTIAQIMHPEDLAVARSSIQQMMTMPDGASMNILRRLKHKDGGWRWLEGTAVNLFDTPGVNGRFVVLQDVTEKKERELHILQLNASLAEFQDAIDRSSAVSRTNLRGDITFVNENFVRMCGYSREELVGSNHRMLSSGAHNAEFWRDMWRTILAGNVWRREIKNKRKDGTFCWADSLVMPLFNSDGTIREFFSVRYDITQRRQAEEELQHSQLILRKANQLARIGYWIYDVKTKRVHWSPLACELLGISGEFAGDIDAFVTQVVHPDDQAMVKETMLRAIDHHELYQVDHRVVLPDGSVRWIHVEVMEMVDDKWEVSQLINVAQDITERKGIEEILREYNERFEILSKATNDAVWDWDVVNSLLQWNHGIEKIFGYADRYVTDPHGWWRKCIHPDDYDRLETSVQNAFRNQENLWSESYRYRCFDGTYKNVLDRAYILYSESEPVRMIGAMQDISRQVESQREIEKLSLVARKTSNLVIMVNDQFAIEWVNDAFLELSGYGQEEIMGEIVWHVLWDGHRDEALMQGMMRVSRGETLHEEIVSYSRLGEKFWFRTTFTPVLNDDSKLSRVIIIATNVTEQKEHASQLSTIARELTNLIETANVPIFGIDKNGFINEWNSACAEASGYARGYMLGKSLTALIDQAHQQASREILNQALQGHPTAHYELPFTSGNGRSVVFLVAASPRRDIHNEIVGVICVAQDLTELYHHRNHLEEIVKERTRELNQALQKEKDLVEMKNRFVSIASHEFRTPLASISIASGFIRKYRERMTDADIYNKLSNIDQQVNHMTSLLDDVLIVGKADAGKIAVQLKQIDLKNVLNHLVEEVEANAHHSHQIQLRWLARQSAFSLDEKLIRNIMINLLTNAIKFSPGHPLVELTVDVKGARLIIHVCDQGIGIPAEDMGKLFQSFQRGSNVNTISGTGLGLSIVKKAVEFLKGEVTVKSELGKGTTFTVSLPAEPETDVRASVQVAAEGNLSAE
jgi:PAS domain S-box-containing protein